MKKRFDVFAMIAAAFVLLAVLMIAPGIEATTLSRSAGSQVTGRG